MKGKLFFLFFLLFLIVSNPLYSQQRVTILARLDTISNTFQVNQKINFKNLYKTPIEKLIINDWNHSYSNRKTHFGKRLSDQYVRNFHLSTEKERGFTEIKKFTVNNFYGNWCRIDDQIDLIELNVSPLQPNDSITIDIEYELKIPDAKFTRWGKEKANFYLKDFFLVLAKIKTSRPFIQYSNENIEDAVLEDIKTITVAFELPNYYSVTSNLNETDKNTFKGTDVNNIQFAVEKKTSFESFKNDRVEVITNLSDSRINEIQKAIIIDKVVNFIDSNLGKSKTEKIMVSQIDYDRNPFYGLNQLPSFLSPFPDFFLYELKFLKVYSQNYLKQNLNIDFRKDHYLLDGIQTYLLINYIEEFYPDLHLLGNLSTYKLTKGYQLSKAKFNDQYQLAYLLMARKSLDQPLNESKEKLVKFNEQIAAKYKAGLAFKFLDNYLQDDSFKKGIKQFLNLNQSQFTSSNEFESIIKKSTSKNINWFFDEMINSNKPVDYSFGNKTTTNDSISVQLENKSNSNVPYLISGFKNRKKVFDKWIDDPKKDSIITINSTEADRLIINKDNYFTEINNRNNYKSLKGFFSLNKPLKFTFLRDVENANYHQVFYEPEIGYNVYDGAILTSTLTNRALIERPFYYRISPSYSTNAKTITGSSIFWYNFFKQNSKQYLTKLTLTGSYFHYAPNASYLSIAPSILFKFRENDLTDNKNKSLLFRQVIVNKEYTPLILDKSPLNYSIFDARYAYNESETAKGMGFSTNLQLAGKFGKFVSEISYRKLFESNYQIAVRFYAGTFIYNNTNTDFFSFGLDRPKDYLFDYQFYGRSETSGLFSQQIIIAEGGFKSKFANPYANQWMTTVNVTSSVWKWVQLYGDIGCYKNKGLNAEFVYDSGVHLNLLPDYFELFFPVYSSNGFELKQKNYNEKIRFVVTLSPKILINLFTRKWF